MSQFKKKKICRTGQNTNEYIAQAHGLLVT